MANLLVLPTPVKTEELAEWRRLQQRNLTYWACRKEWPQYHKESSWQVRQSQKGKEQNRLSKAPDRKVEDSQGEREPHLAE